MTYTLNMKCDYDRCAHDKNTNKVNTNAMGQREIGEERFNSLRIRTNIICNFSSCFGIETHFIPNFYSDIIAHFKCFIALRLSMAFVLFCSMHFLLAAKVFVCFNHHHDVLVACLFTISIVLCW